MREGWKMKSLSEVCKELFAGGDVPKDRISKFITKDFNIPIYSNGATNDGLYGYTDIPRVTKKSITVSARGTIGYSVIRTQSYLPVVRLIVLIPDEEIVTLPFLKYVIETMDFSNSGSSIPQLTVPMIKKYKAPIPPLQEQQQIVTILDQAFEAIDQAKANIEKNIENAKELFQSKLNDIFSQKGDGWEEKKLKEICEIRPNKKEAKEFMKPNDEVSFVPMKYLSENSRCFNSPEIKKLKDVYSGYVYFREGDVVLAKITPCFENGKLGIAKGLKNGVGFGSSEYIPFRVDSDKLFNEYLYFFLNRKVFRNKGERLMSGAVGHKRIQPSFYEEEIIAIPTLKKQIEISLNIKLIQNALENAQNSYRKKLDYLEELKKSILQKAFAGELTYETVEV